MEDTRLGGILLESRIIREEDLEYCLEIQALSAAGGGTTAQRPLGQILIEERLIDASTLEKLLRVQDKRRRRKLGSIPVEGEEPALYLETAVSAGASELHLSEGRQPLARVAGELRTLDAQPLAGPEVWQFVREHMGPQTLEAIAERNAVTTDYLRQGVARGRITAFRHSDGIGVTVRLHPAEVRPLEDKDLLHALRQPIQRGQGMILLTGESGNGITETFATLLHEVCSGRKSGDESSPEPNKVGRNVVVLDDSIEYPEPGEDGGARVTMRRVGVHARDYRSGLRAAIRTEPDAIFLGDVSDPETFNLALHAAESGRLVVAVLHASSTTAALKRAISFFPSYVHGRVRSILASVLNCVVGVRLVPGIDRDRFHLATEVLRFDEAVREIVRSGSIEKLKLLLRLEEGDHGHPFDQSLLALLNGGLTSFEDVFPFAQDKTLFLQSIDAPLGGADAFDELESKEELSHG